MRFSRFVAVALLVTYSIAFISCSGAKVGSEKGKASSVYPEWYKQQLFVPDTDGFRGYATALAGDSSSAAQKAVAQAQDELKSGISRRLELVRKKAVDELGRSSGLNTPGFIVTLRKAENSVANAAERAHVATGSNENYSGYRGFAEAAVKKEALMRELDEAMGRYKTAWSAMKESQAFSGF